ncbi:primosomal replication protein PriC [Sodalis endosymbiont of Henestaris halophilus]|uniref:primosomal replication protein PriC n=1 Tax=Sodalis endosymbiont of Henestaris halophilus TaxID=1929246 RepID=UPI000BE433EF|nr:primosomal replication protein PriC [Sodalis endosymbiont of Henestaris halophilus]
MACPEINRSNVGFFILCELATHNLRQTLPATVMENIYARLAEYYGYKRRLLAMIRDRYSLHDAVDDLVYIKQLQKEIAALTSRLQRCRQALVRLEYKIKLRKDIEQEKYAL